MDSTIPLPVIAMAVWLLVVDMLIVVDLCSYEVIYIHEAIRFVSLLIGMDHTFACLDGQLRRITHDIKQCLLRLTFGGASPSRKVVYIAKTDI